jgi:hypothetical protein
MKIYLGIVGSSKVQKFAQEHKCGWCLTPDNARDPKEIQYFLDNGAFAAWKHKRLWDEGPFLKLVEKYPDYEFVVAPDIVCGGRQSLVRSLEYVGKIPGALYLAVQDGMQGNTVSEYIDYFDGLFIGGSIPWKFSTARMWADIAHLYGKKCHAGRVGTWEGFVHMHFSGVDSVDTTTASRHQNDSHIRKYLDHLKKQTRLFRSN